MSALLVGIAGAGIVATAVWATFMTFNRGQFRARGYRVIRRKRHPVIFWMNALGIGSFGVLGIALMGWAFVN